MGEQENRLDDETMKGAWGQARQSHVAIRVEEAQVLGPLTLSPGRAAGREVSWGSPRGRAHFEQGLLEGIFQLVSLWWGKNWGQRAARVTGTCVLMPCACRI